MRWSLFSSSNISFHLWTIEFSERQAWCITIDQVASRHDSLEEKKIEKNKNKNSVKLDVPIQHLILDSQREWHFRFRTGLNCKQHVYIK